MHASCESLFTEDDVEQAADEGFDCVSCQPYVVKPAGEYQCWGRAGVRAEGLASGQGLKLPWCVFLSTAPAAPPELVPMKVKEPGESPILSATARGGLRRCLVQVSLVLRGGS